MADTKHFNARCWLELSYLFYSYLLIIWIWQSHGSPSPKTHPTCSLLPPDSRNIPPIQAKSPFRSSPVHRSWLPASKISSATSPNSPLCLPKTADCRTPTTSCSRRTRNYEACFPPRKKEGRQSWRQPTNYWRKTCWNRTRRWKNYTASCRKPGTVKVACRKEGTRSSWSRRCRN